MLNSVLSNSKMRIIALLMAATVMASGVFGSASIAVAATPVAPQSAQGQSVSQPTERGKVSFFAKQAKRLLQRNVSRANAVIDGAIQRLPLPQYVKNNLKAAIGVGGLINALDQVTGYTASVEDALSKGLQIRYPFLSDAWADRIAGALVTVLSPI